MSRFYKKKFANFRNFQNSNFVIGKVLKIRSTLNLPWGHVRSYNKFGSDFNVYWIQTNRQTNKDSEPHKTVK